MRNTPEAALGLSVHTGWAAMIAVSGVVRAAEILDRRRVEMLTGTDPPRFAYHAARELAPAAGQRLVDDAAERSRAHARAALEDALSALGDHRAVAAGVVVGNQPLDADYATIVESHARIHAAEGALFRGAIADACRALRLRVIEVRAADLEALGAAAMGVRPGELARRLDAFGHAAGRPWSKDQRDAYLAALISLG